MSGENCPITGKECTGFRCEGPAQESISVSINGKQRETTLIKRCGRPAIQLSAEQRVLKDLLKYSGWDE